MYELLESCARIHSFTISSRARLPKKPSFVKTEAELNISVSESVVTLRVMQANTSGLSVRSFCQISRLLSDDLRVDRRKFDIYP